MEAAALSDPEPVITPTVWHHLTHHGQVDEKNLMTIVRGLGMRIWDQHGKEYLDATSGGVWSVNVGYGREEIADAVRDQLVQMCYFAQTLGSEPARALSARLIEKMPGMSRVYFANSGSEANEKAFKMVRQIAHKRYGGEKKYKILYRERDYHGSSIGCLSATGQEQRRDQYGPYVPGFVSVPHCLEYRSQWGEVVNYGERAAAAIEEVILREGPETIGALCLEAVTAGGGVIPPPEGYWPAVQALCRKYDILLHIDEVVCGLGRTGAWFGYQHYGIEPDFVSLAKGLASGYAAISALVTSERVFDAIHEDSGNPQMDYFRDISTFGGCAGGLVAALKNIEIIEREGLVENTAKRGEQLLERLEELKSRHVVIGDVRGKGLFIGVELVADRVSKQPVRESYVAAVAAHCLKNGVMIGRTNRSFVEFNNTLCLSPSLIIGDEEIDRIVTAIDNALAATDLSLV
ncbi:MAG: taurine-pyruvate aminotransferase [Glaciecola sp.]|jgi:taurine-pyruvate aminotransferase|uniref:aminotransferase family protein n=1 Tax=Congregibacter sp. TaxID=2744308 RepID=UPI0039E589E5